MILPVVGFAGPKGAGKTKIAKTVWNLLTERGYNPVILSFADPIRVIGGRIFNLTYTQMTDPIEKEKIDSNWGLSPRQIMQKFGTESMRHIFGEDIWIKVLEHKITKGANTIFLIDDVRFPNEAHWIHANYGLIYYIHNIRITGKEAYDNHASESHHEYIKSTYAHFLINNSNYKRDLSDNLKRIGVIEEIEAWYTQIQNTQSA